MTHNKILMAATVAALSVGGTVLPAAASGTFSLNGTNISPNSPKIAYELFEAGGDYTLPNGGNTFNVMYTFNESEDIFEDFTVKLTLIGAVWENDPTSVEISNTPGLEISTDSVTMNSITYQVRASEFTVGKNEQLTVAGFTIRVQDLDSLGNQAQMNISLSGRVNDYQTITLAKLVEGTKVNILPAGNSGISSGGFDPGVNGDPRRALIGTLEMENNAGVYTQEMNTFTPVYWDFTANTPKSGSLTISPLPVLPAGTKLFLDSNNDCNSGTGAVKYESSWSSFDDDDINDLDNTHYVCIELPDGNTNAIGTMSMPPLAQLTVDYNPRSVTYQGDLRHLESSSSALCKVYNVTDDHSDYKSNVRITNKSFKPATIKGTLRDMSNNIIFQDKVLGTVNAKGTLRLGSEKLEEYAGGQTWGYGILTLNATDIPAGKMDVLLLFRNWDTCCSLVNMTAPSTCN